VSPRNHAGWTQLDWYKTVFEVIDMRSFSNLWYWIGLAVIWSTTSHWVLGVPYDMVTRARRNGGQAEQDLQDMVRINCNRFVFIGHLAGVWLLAFDSMIIAVLATLGFWYGVEFAQALFLFVFPLSVVGLISFAAARRISADMPRGELLHRRLTRHRILIQVIGMLSVFVTAMWGMYQNLATSPLGQG